MSASIQHSPCESCTKRKVGCHSKCNDYQNYKTEVSFINETISNAKSLDNYFVGKIKERSRRNKK